MNKKQISRLLLAVLACSLLLSGCDSRSSTSSAALTSTETEVATTEEETMPAEVAFAPQLTGIYVMRDGTVKSAEIVSFSNKDLEQERYTEKGLRSFVESEIADYNQTKTKEAVVLEQLTVKDETATLILRYLNADYFLEFQGSDFGVYSLEIVSCEYAARNYVLTGLKDREGNTAPVTTAISDDTVTVVAVCASNVPVTVSGEIRYLSNNLQTSDGYMARVNSKDKLTPSYILFK